MFKKIILTGMILACMVFVFSLESYATNLDDDTPFSFESLPDNKVGHRLESVFFEIPDDPEFLYFYIPRSSYSILNTTIDGVSYHSYMYFYKSDYSYNTTSQLDSVSWFTDTWDIEFDGIQQITCAGSPFADTDNAYFRVILIQDYAVAPSQTYMDWFNARFTFIFDSETIDVATGLNTLTYYVGSTVWYKIGFNDDDIPDKPIDPKHETLIFNGWKTVDGEIYDFTEPLEVYAPLASDLTLTASWRFSWEPNPDTTITDNTGDFLNIMLSVAGLNNPIGKIIVYFVIMIVVTFILIYFKLQTFIMLLINGLLFGVFVYLGWLPIYIIIVMGLAFLLGLFQTFKGGN